MTVSFVAGKDMFDSECKTLVCPVNLVGVMGNGLAKYMSIKYPGLKTKYLVDLKTKQLSEGRLSLFKFEDRYILLFPTKRDWRHDSDLSLIEKGLVFLLEQDKLDALVSIAFPKLGCGKGKLLWTDVKPVMESYLEKLSVPCFVFE